MLNLLISVSLLVSPLRLEVSLYPGIATRDLSIKNGDAYNEVNVTVYSKDWDLNERGKIQYHDAGTLDGSCSKWITINPAEFTLGPGETKDVRITFDIPQESAGGYWSVILFEGNPPVQEEWTPLVKLAGRVGISTYLEVAGTTFKEAEIEWMKQGKDGGLNLELKNKCNIWLRPSIKYWLMRGSEEIYRDSVAGSVILPGGLREYKLELADIKIQKGDEIVARVDYDGEKILEGIKKID
jgi:P pilus assembly chaperone PapD